MTETVPLAGPLKERAKEGVERLLLAPVFLIYEIVAVLFPGVLFIILLLVKGNHSVVSALQSPLLGYKTKLCVALVLGYLVGNVFSTPTDSLSRYFAAQLLKEVQQPGSKRMPGLLNKFFVGVFVLPGLYVKEHALDYLVLSFMNVSFSITTGTVLLVSSLIPGDTFRGIEAATGALLVIRGYKGFRACYELAVSLLGVTLSEAIQKLFPGNWPDAFQAALKLISSQSPSQTSLQTAQPQPSPNAPITTPQSPPP
jgi:hypothetical protein